jgi:hypothetical protein
VTNFIPRALAEAQLVPVPAGEKAPRSKGWPDLRLSAEQAAQHVAHGGNLALRLGQSSGDLVDVDLDCHEALALADLYLPPTGAEFGRPSKPRSHRLYVARGASYASFADPSDGSMLIELRADGRDGGAHLTLLPPSVADGERRAWHGATVEPAKIDAAVLARRMGWLAIGCAVARHVSEHAARRPGPDLPDLLWEGDRALGRRAFHWIGRLAPDERPPDLKPRRQYTNSELRLEEIVAAIPNDCGWEAWNRVGLAIFAASGGSQLGFVAFDDFSAKSPKYDPHAVLERWNNYRRSPPSRISLGSLVHLAREAGWRPSDRKETAR